MKSQLIPIAFAVFVVALSLLGFVFFNLFYGKKYETYVFELNVIDKIRNVLEILKGYLGLSLTYSAHQAMREHASLGGITLSGAWICNGPNPVSFEKTKECLEKYTTYYLNIYADKFEISLPLEIKKDEIKKCMYGISKNEVLSGKVDEGNFWVNCSSINVLINSKNVQELEKAEIEEYLTKNRFWYMFRIFTEWANEDIFSHCVYTCTASCQGCGCVEECAKKAFNDLVKRFDKYVECEMKRVCCERREGPACLSPSDPLPWIEDNPCPCKCTHECIGPPLPEIGVSLPSEPEIVYERVKGPRTFSILSFSGQNLNCKCDYWYENRLTAHYQYVCADHKYYIPSSKGPLPLIFKVIASTCWRDQDACKSTNICECPGTATSCKECDNRGCCEACHS